ncbi:helix-turn-helix domain-containing protein [Nocardia sp. R6R-6]|uniref:helix-turn-helix domain-containing protein n=1 Tax=Nocardia sp. R6R-6 TaxID=3459303 RepID=UPI00403DD28A
MDTLHEGIRNIFCAMTFKPSGEGKSTLIARRVDRSTLSRVSSRPGDIWREKQHLSMDYMESWKVIHVIGGRVGIEQNERSFVLSPGETGVYDMDRPYRLHIPKRAFLAIVSVPKDALNLAGKNSRDLTTEKLPKRPGVTTLLAGFLECLATELPVLDEQALFGVNSSARALLSLALHEHFNEEQPIDRLEKETIQAVREFIMRNIMNPELAPALIASAFHMSVRQLHRMFQNEDVSVGREIRVQRMRRAAEELRDPRRRGQKLSDIAARLGSPDPSTFSRQFRSVIGVSPREYRAAHQR